MFVLNSIIAHCTFSTLTLLELASNLHFFFIVIKIVELKHLKTSQLKLIHIYELDKKNTCKLIVPSRFQLKQLQIPDDSLSPSSDVFTMADMMIMICNYVNKNNKILLWIEPTITSVIVTQRGVTTGPAGRIN